MIQIIMQLKECLEGNIGLNAYYIRIEERSQISCLNQRLTNLYLWVTSNLSPVFVWPVTQEWHLHIKMAEKGSKGDIL